MINLEKDQWLLKVAVDNYEPNPLRRKVGFLTKPTKTGNLPVAFADWRKYQVSPEYKIHKEEFNSGWKVIGYRRGASQDWCVLLHPKGFTLEVYMVDFIHKVSSGVISIYCGEIREKCKWIGNNIEAGENHSF